MTMYTTLYGPSNHGVVRWNGSGRNLEAMDPYGGWGAITLQPTLPPDTLELIEWARQQRERQRQLSELRKQYPTLDQALTHAEVIEALVSGT